MDCNPGEHCVFDGAHHLDQPDSVREGKQARDHERNELAKVAVALVVIVVEKERKR